MKKYIYAALVGTLAFLGSAGQNPPLHKTITGTETGTKLHQAQLSITFDKNYTYQPNGGNLKAEIVNPTVGDIAYQTPVNPDSYSINTTLPVGSLSDELQVNGFLNYAVNFDVPKGAAGLQPTLGLAYSSNFVDGMVGLGFNLTGLSAITRTGKTIYHDGTSSAISGNQWDAYSMDGKRLLLITGNYGESTSTYGTEMEEFSKIVAVGSSESNQGPLSFVVYTKSGVILEYGNTPDSRVMRNSSCVLVWKLNKISDHFGNCINYEYYLHDDEHPIHKIGYNYGYPASSSPGSEITFRYKRRTDKSVYVFGGNRFTRDLLLDNIEIKNNNQLFRNYSFEYTSDNYSQLMKITQSSSTGQLFNPVVFSWTTLSQQYSRDKDRIWFTSDKWYFHGDYNGDGITDYVTVPIRDNYSSSHKWELFIGAASGTFSKTSEGSLKTGFKRFLTGDFDGDGRTDMVMEVEDLQYFKYTNYRSNGNSFTVTGSEYSVSNTYTHRTVTDLNGDGVHEIFLYIQYANMAGIPKYKYETRNIQGQIMQQRDEEYSYGSWSPFVRDFFQPDMILDFNGDGRSDFLNLSETGWAIYQVWDGVTKIKDGNNINNTNDIRYGDFNGDGTTDVLKLVKDSNGNPQWSVLFYTSDGFKDI